MPHRASWRCSEWWFTF